MTPWLSSSDVFRFTLSKTEPIVSELLPEQRRSYCFFRLESIEDGIIKMKSQTKMC